MTTRMKKIKKKYERFTIKDYINCLNGHYFKIISPTLEINSMNNDEVIRC